MFRLCSRLLVEVLDRVGVEREALADVDSASMLRVS